DEKEVEELFGVIRKLRAQGLGIVLVTHFLDQVYGISDRITVLRDGRLVGEYETAKLPRVELVSRMIGKELAQMHQVQEDSTSTPASVQEPLLELKGFGAPGSLAPLDMAIAKGEIVGLA